MIFFDERRNTITLSTAATTYQMKVDSTGVLLHTYYGPRLRAVTCPTASCMRTVVFRLTPTK